MVLSSQHRPYILQKVFKSLQYQKPIHHLFVNMVLLAYHLCEYRQTNHLSF